VSVERFHLSRFQMSSPSFTTSGMTRMPDDSIGPELPRWKAIAAERADLPGGGDVSEKNDKIAEAKKPPPKPLRHRKFEKLLKQAVKAPSMSRPAKKLTPPG